MLDELPEEDRLLHEEQDRQRALELAHQAVHRANTAANTATETTIPISTAEVEEHKHEWVDMYVGGGFKRGNPTVGLQAFFCKWCLEIQIKEFSQSKYNLRNIEDEADFRDD